MPLQHFNSDLCTSIQSILEVMSVEITNPIYTLPDGEIHVEGRIIPTLDITGYGFFNSVTQIGEYIKNYLSDDSKFKGQIFDEYVPLHKEDVGVLNLHIDGKLEKIVFRKEHV